MKWFGNVSGIFKRSERIDWLDMLDDLKPTTTSARIKGGSIAFVRADAQGERVLLDIRRKIAREDVREGKLIRAREGIKRRGGKHSTAIMLDYRSAEALHAALGSAIKKARTRRFFSELAETLVKSMYVTTVEWRRS